MSAEHVSDFELLLSSTEISNAWYCIYGDLNWWKSPLVKVGIITDIFGPSEIIAEGIAMMGRKCMEFINKKEHRNFQVGYRIELLPVTNQKEWEYIMQLDTITWFDMLHKLSGDLQNTLKTARNYVNNVRKSHRLLEFNEATKGSIPSKVYCGHHADCIYPPPPNLSESVDKKKIWKAHSVAERPSKHHNSNNEEPPVFCAGLAPQQIRSTRYCNWYVEKERIIIGEDGKDGWICVSQQEDVREILICSHPGTYSKSAKPENHKTNKDLVVDVDFWIWVLGYFMGTYLVETICKQQIKYPVNLFALNFGRWESAEAKDFQAKECHGHLHVHISPDVVIAFETAGIDAMFGKIGLPKQYGIQNCVELETNRMLSSEMQYVLEKIDGMDQKIGEIDQKIDTILDLIKKKL